MAAANSLTEKQFAGYPLFFYCERLDREQIDEVLFWAKFCCKGDAPARLLGAYLGALLSYELRRREAIDEGFEILECVMPPIPAHAWEPKELAGALGKLTSIVCSEADGPVRELFARLLNVVTGVVQSRLGLKN